MRRLGLIQLAIAGLLLAGCGGDTAPADSGGGGDTAEATGEDVEVKDVTLTLNWVPYGEHAPFYYGVSEGIYEDAGINLTVKPGNGSGNTIQQVAAQQTDFGWADTPALMNGVAAGMPVTSLGVFLQKGPASLEFFADQGITEPADLKGKTVAGTPGDAMYATFPAWLELNGLTTDDVNLVNVDPSGKIAALIEGKTDVIMGFFHDQAATIEDKSGKEVEVLLYADFGMNLLSTGIVANTALLEEDPELAEAFVEATRKSWEAAVDNPEGAVKAMAENAGETPPEDVLAEQFDQTIPLLNLEKAGRPGVNTEEQWQETIDLLSDGGMLEEAGEPEDYWRSTFSEDAG
jgi:NitT/TauT family transport system substrate-binding protein